MKLVKEIKKEENKKYIIMWLTILICIVFIILGDMLRDN